MHGIKLGLDNMVQLVGALDLDVTSRGPCRWIHVAGTNGKGSVCAMIASICRAAGLKTALYTSPHLIEFRERIVVDGEQISEGGVVAGLNLIRDIAAGREHPPTFFEITTALAMWWFVQCCVEAAVLETGMGGRLDATNVVCPVVSVITPISMDHGEYLGRNLAEIAGEKAGIIKDRVPVVSSPQEAEAASVLQSVGGSRLQIVSAPWVGELGLPGEFQRWNAALAIAALEAGEFQPSLEAIAQGLRSIPWPGRFQRLPGDITLDGAHNPAAARCLAETWRAVRGPVKATLVFACMRDKDVAAICAELAEVAGTVIATPTRNPRSATPEELASIWDATAPTVPCRMAPDTATALSAAQRNGGPILVAGSLFLVGEALAILQGTLPPRASSQ